MPDAYARKDAAAGTQIGLTAPDGSTRRFRARAITATTLAITLPRPVASIAIARRTRAMLAGPALRSSGSDGSVFVADGQLQAALVPSHWTFARFHGSFAVFANQFAQRPLRLEALPGRSTSGAWIKDSSGPPAAADGGHGVLPARCPRRSLGGGDLRLERHVAALAWPGDHAYRPAGRSRPSRRRTAGLGVVTWSYTPPLFPAGLCCRSRRQRLSFSSSWPSCRGPGT